jgi:hypothetical protein
MHAYIISGQNPDSIELKVKTLISEWQVSQFDTLIVEKEEEKKEISIQQIRAMTRQLMLTPTQGPFIVAIIKEAHRMTVAAQNAILKILEEPPAKVKILLTTSTPDALLQTISSRCERYVTIDNPQTHANDAITLESLFLYEKSSISQMLTSLDSLSITGLDARNFVDGALKVLHSAIRSNSSAPYGPEKCANLAKILLKTRMQLASNVNQKLAVDSAFLEARQG